MSNVLQSLQCPQCGGRPLADNGDGTITCPYCGAAFAHPEYVCPHCETVNEPDARHCASCGATLREPCPRCGALNLVNAPHCHGCGAALDVLEQIALRRAETTAERLRRLEAEMPAIKEEAERASEERLAKMWARDEARLDALAKAQTERRRQERIIWIIASAAILFLLACVLAFTLFAQLRAH